MEFLANDKNHDMSLSEAAKIEENNSVLQLEGQVDMRDRYNRSLDDSSCAGRSDREGTNPGLCDSLEIDSTVAVVGAV